MDANGFEGFLYRVRQETGAKTQVELAALLGIRQSSISDAKRRGSIPSEWLIKLLDAYSLSPAWLMSGEGPRYMAPSEDKITVASMTPKVEEPKPILPSEAVAAFCELFPGASVTVRWVGPGSYPGGPVGA